MTKTDLKTYVMNLRGASAQPLYHCSACYYDYSDVIILRSYSTKVAVYYKRTGTLYVFDYYSATTSQHVCKFAKLVGAIRITYLYERSDRVIEKAVSHYANTFKLSAKEFREVKANDYRGYIGNP